jgi:hypothetical protein
LKTTMKTSLKIPKGKSESVYRRKTDNTMVKRKCTKGQIGISCGVVCNQPVHVVLWR